MWNSGRVSKGLPQANPETNEAAHRAGRYGEQYVIPIHGQKVNLALEGSYFIATNPTPFTGVAMTTSIVTFAETAGAVGVFLLIKNLASRSDPAAKQILLDYIKLMVTAVPTSATSWQYAITLDDNPVRYTSGGSAITPVCPGGSLTPASIAQIYAGALTTAVPNNRKLVARGTLRGVIPTVLDEYVIVSGGIEGGSGFASAAASGRSVDVCPPIVIDPQQNMALTMWGASNGAAPAFEFETGWAER